LNREADVTDQAGAVLDSVKFPWSPDGDVAANLAIGNLRNSLMGSLANERGIHAETLFVVLGAIAGQAAAHAFWERDPKMGVDFMDIETRDGRHFFYGDALNGYLVRQQGSVLPVWEIVAGAAIKAGVSPTELPDLKEIFAHVTDTLGGPNFGIVRTPPEHQPGAQPMQALQIFWPLALQVLTQTMAQAIGRRPEPADLAPVPTPKPEPTASGFGRAMKGMFGRKQPAPPQSQRDIWGDTLARQHWPIVVGIVAGGLIGETKGVLDPGWAVKIFMEAAVPMSKLHPKEFPQTLPEKAG
jgi:hypothetical protein